MAFAKISTAWRQHTHAADRVRLLFAAGFVFGALSHFGWVAVHGVFYHGPAPAWAVWFWYGLCALDFAYVLLGLTAFGVIYAALLPWLWANASRRPAKTSA
jgi:hypothetical protein